MAKKKIQIELLPTGEVKGISAPMSCVILDADGTEVGLIPFYDWNVSESKDGRFDILRLFDAEGNQTAMFLGADERFKLIAHCTCPVCGEECDCELTSEEVED